STRSVLVFFQAEDGIRDKLVTGVQTCALPIWRARMGCRKWMPRERSPCRRTYVRSGRARRSPASYSLHSRSRSFLRNRLDRHREIGRASCRERVEDARVEGSLSRKDMKQDVAA